jgi:hypothetical protein
MQQPVSRVSTHLSSSCLLNFGILDAHRGLHLTAVTEMASGNVLASGRISALSLQPRICRPALDRSPLLRPRLGFVLVSLSTRSLQSS